MAKKTTKKEPEAEEKKTTAKKTTAKKSTAKKTAAKKSTTKTAKTADKAEANTKAKTATKKTTAAKSTAKKTTAKKTTAKKSTKAETKKIDPNNEISESGRPKLQNAAEEKAKRPYDPSLRYSDEDLDMFRNIIMESKNEALDELRMLKDRLEDLTNYDFAEESMIYSMHMAEQGSEALEKEKTYAQIQRIHDYIKKLDEALNRIKDKTYGVCRVCGCLIAKARLMAVPITTLSASYKIHQKCPEDGIDRIEARNG